MSDWSSPIVWLRGNTAGVVSIYIPHDLTQTCYRRMHIAFVNMPYLIVDGEGVDSDNDEEEPRSRTVSSADMPPPRYSSVLEVYRDIGQMRANKANRGDKNIRSAQVVVNSGTLPADRTDRKRNSIPDSSAYERIHRKLLVEHAMSYSSHHHRRIIDSWSSAAASSSQHILHFYDRCPESLPLSDIPRSVAFCAYNVRVDNF